MSRRILFVDDDEEMGRAVCQMLNILDFEVDYAYYAPTAFKKLSEKDYDLMITDYDMPEVNGVDLIEAVKRRLGKKIPMLVLTSGGLDDFTMERIKVVSDGVLFKPLTFEDLEEIIIKFSL